ncbi:MAG: glycosyltransferase family 2 protein [Chloroflexi bacterium]|nr:glycosyltransferase family 2 protein [Chloroflexota bacterium]
MAARLVAIGVLGLSAGLALMAVIVPIVARGLQVAVLGSVAYIGWLAWRGRSVIARAMHDGAGPPPAELGPVTIIVPARNEAAIIGGTVASLGALNALGADGGAAHEVLVVDDASRDATPERAGAAAAGLPAIRVLSRPPADGPRTKGAALAWAMPQAAGRIIAVMDADSRVTPHLLDAVARAWARDPTAAAIQVRRLERNAGSSWLAGAQDDEQVMDLVSQCGRWAGGGNAELRGNGMFVRREVLDAIGGWSTTAITEDLELSTRLAVHGWHVALGPEVQVTEEAVETIGALWRQRRRWAEGSIRRLVTHGPALLSGRLPLGRKVDFLAFATEFFVPPLLLLTLLACVVLALASGPADWTVPASLVASYLLGMFLLALAGLHALGERGAGLVGRALRGSLFLSHWLLVVPVVLARMAALSPTRDFSQTPRFGGDVE